MAKDYIFEIEIRLPLPNRDAVIYRHRGPDSEIPKAIEYYLKIHNESENLNIKQCLWRYAGSMYYQVYSQTEE